MSQPELVSLTSVFAILDDWRRLPAYRLEPRVDPFAAVFLRPFLEARLGVSLHSTVIPELPLRLSISGKKGKESNRSNKVDFALCASDRSVVYLLEFKTDTSSRRAKQDKYLEHASANSFDSLLGDIRKIRGASKRFRAKYSALAAKLAEWGFPLDEPRAPSSVPVRVEVRFIEPKGSHPDFGFRDFADFIAGQPGEVASVVAKYLSKWESGPHEPAT